MKINIIENELYLAQSIAGKLNEHGYETEIFSAVGEAMESHADVILLSTNLPGQNMAPLIEKHKEKIIILMVSYINNDTVGEPLRLGAKDYIVKPFMIEELLRKIEHYREYQQLKESSTLFERYIDELFKEINLELEGEKVSPPLLIVSNYKRAADKLVFDFGKTHRKVPYHINLEHKGWQEEIAATPPHLLLYLYNLQSLKKSEREKLYNMLDGRLFFLHTNSETEAPFKSLEIKSDAKLYDQNEILTIDDYVKYIVNTYQYKYPDTELSKKLGISRKSLWEKRKKFGLFKKR